MLLLVRSIPIDHRLRGFYIRMTTKQVRDSSSHQVKIIIVEIQKYYYTHVQESRFQ